MTEKDIISVNILTDMHRIIEEWFDLWIPDYIERDIDHSLYLSKSRKIVSLTGCRRVGKTYIIFQLIDHLFRNGVEKERLIYVNFEDERIIRKTDTLTSLIPTLIEKYGDRDYYLFLDELHVMPDWDIWLRRVFDRYRNFEFFITGSSSRLSMKELPTALRGRTVNLEIFPLDFNEYLSFNEINERSLYSEKGKAILMGQLNDYLVRGGFPEVVNEDDQRRRKLIVQDYFRTIITLDMAERHNLRNIGNIQDYMKILLGTTIYSTNKLEKVFRSMGRKIGKETLMDYSRYVEETYFGFFIPIFSFKIKDRLQYPRKFYVIDTSFLSYILIRHNDDLGRYYENVVALHLIKKFGMDNISYWKDRKGHEVDFIIKEGARVHKLIQVCCDIKDPKTKERELRALMIASDELSCNDLLMITKDKEYDDSVEGKNVSSISLLRFLMEEM